MPLSSKASYLIEEPPEFELRDGLFYVRQTIGDETYERVMRPSTFARLVWRGEQALALFRSGANVVEIKAKVPPEKFPASHG